MSRPCVTDAVVQLIANNPSPPIEVATRDAYVYCISILLLLNGKEIEGASMRQVWGKWSNDGAGRQLAVLMEEGIRTTLTSIVSKALLITSFLLDMFIHLSDCKSEASVIKPEPSAPL